MAWCDVVEPRTLRECRIALGQSQTAFAAMLGVSPESYRTWDAGRRATPPKMLARARALATHRNDQALLPLPVLALQIDAGTYLVYDGACGTGGMLTVAEETLAQLAAQRGRQVATHLYGHEINAETYAIAKADLGPDPLPWTPNPCGRRSPRCRKPGSPIRQSFVTSWSR